MKTARTLLLAAVVGILATAAAAGPVGTPQGIRPVPDPPPYCPPERLDVRVWADRSVYDVGDDVGLRFRVSRDSFVYVFSTDSCGVTRRIFPNPWDRDNFVAAGRTYYLPRRGYRYVADGPPGVETIHAIATTENYGWLRDEYCRFSGDPYPVCQDAPRSIFMKLDSSARGDYESKRQGFEVRIEGGSGGFRARAEIRPVPVPTPPPPVWVWSPPAFGEAWDTIRIRGRAYYHPVPSPPVYHIPHPPGPPFRPPVATPHECGSLVIESWPPKANVYIDGGFVGQTPLQTQLPEENYEVVVERPGYKPWERRLRLEEGRTEKYNLRLSPW